MHTEYPLAEVFYSIQGEGYYTGTPMVFIRLAGCNYKCHWCDTDFRLRFKATASAISLMVADLTSDPLHTRHVCFTGGEPTIHDLNPIMDAIDKIAGRTEYHIESNGGAGHEGYLARAFVTVSPKDPDGGPLDNGHWICDELKVIDQGQGLEHLLATTTTGRPARFYLQPLSTQDERSTMENMERTAKRVMEDTRWKLSVQMHKIAGLR